MEFNRYYKRIRLAFDMTEDDVVECCRLGGLQVSRSRPNGWNRSPDDKRRYVRMREDDFEAFTAGLPEWSVQSD